jgi:hypothetical protein
MKFSIRDLFLVTVIVALVLGWWLDRIRMRAIYLEAVERFEAKPSLVAYRTTRI